jgi:hypothetical protein
MSTPSVNPIRIRLLALVAAILLLLASAGEAIAGAGCAHHGAAAMGSVAGALHGDAGAGTDHARFPGEHRACTCVGDCLAPTAILPPDAAIQPAEGAVESQPSPFPARALDPHGYAPHTLPYAQAPPLAG